MNGVPRKLPTAAESDMLRTENIPDHVFSGLEEDIKFKRQLQWVQKLGALGALASGIAHDFNNYLTPIIGYAELLQIEHKDNATLARPLEEILSAARRASHLTQQILTFTRQKTDCQGPVRLDRVVRETIQLLRAFIPASVLIQQEMRDVGTVKASPTQIQQVVMNLCINAYQAMKSKGGVLRLAVEKQTGRDERKIGLTASSYAKLTVQDNGTGIPEEILDRVFEPFFTTKEMGAGAGMGLSMVREIIDECKGRIAVETVLGEGTTFSVYFPLYGKREKVCPNTPLQMDSLPRGVESIMVVDDERAVARTFEALLAQLGYQVTAFDNSLDALDAFRRGPERFDLVISNVSMPGLSGLELAEALLHIRPGLPVVLQTGYLPGSEPLTEGQPYPAEIKQIFTKPVGIHQYAVEIRRILNETKI